MLCPWCYGPTELLNKVPETLNTRATQKVGQCPVFMARPRILCRLPQNYWSCTQNKWSLPQKMGQWRRLTTKSGHERSKCIETTSRQKTPPYWILNKNLCKTIYGRLERWIHHFKQVFNRDYIISKNNLFHA